MDAEWRALLSLSALFLLTVRTRMSTRLPVVRVTSELSDWVSLQLIASRILVISTRLIRVISHKKSVHEDECEYSEAMSTSN